MKKERAAAKYFTPAPAGPIVNLRFGISRPASYVPNVILYWFQTLKIKLNVPIKNAIIKRLKSKNKNAPY